MNRLLLLLCLVATVPGCSTSKPPEFRLNTEERDAVAISQRQQEAIRETLNTLFGVFKYTATAGGAKPLREDLLRTLQEGIPGMAMPSFRKLPGEQLDALLEYVKYLAIRGETELHLLQSVIDEDASLPLDLAEVIEEGLLPAAKSWDDAPSMAVIPPTQPFTNSVPLLRRSSAGGDPSPGTACEQAVAHDGEVDQVAGAITRGRKLFLGAGQCVRCHGTRGDGRGEQSELYDDWNKRKVGDSPERTRKLACRFRLPPERLHPRDFTLGIFHGGDRPIDQYWRIYVGIKGVPMPPHGPSPGSKGVLTPAEIWDLVSYVRSLGRRDKRDEG